MRKITIIFFVFFCNSLFGQSGDLELLKKEILLIQQDVERINVNLGKSKSKFQKGIFVATLGYSITIAGGMMLGRKNDELGQALLITGGATGGLGTYLLVDAFKFLGRTRRERQK